MCGSCGRYTSIRPARLTWVDKARALGADRILHDLHQHRVALVDHPFDRWRLLLRELAILPDVRDVQERGALESDVDERGLHAGQHARDAAEVDVADQSAHRAALDVQLLHDAGEQHRHPRLLRRDVDEDVFHSLAKCTQGACAIATGVTDEIADGIRRDRDWAASAPTRGLRCSAASKAARRPAGRARLQRRGTACRFRLPSSSAAVRPGTAGGGRRALLPWRSALARRLRCAARPKARRDTRCVRCANSAQQAAASQTRSALRAPPSGLRCSPPRKSRPPPTASRAAAMKPIRAA